MPFQAHLISEGFLVAQRGKSLVHVLSGRNQDPAKGKKKGLRVKCFNIAEKYDE